MKNTYKQLLLVAAIVAGNAYGADQWTAAQDAENLANLAAIRDEIQSIPVNNLGLGITIGATAQAAIDTEKYLNRKNVDMQKVRDYYFANRFGKAKLTVQDWMNKAGTKISNGASTARSAFNNGMNKTRSALETAGTKISNGASAARTTAIDWMNIAKTAILNNPKKSAAAALLAALTGYGIYQWYTAQPVAQEEAENDVDDLSDAEWVAVAAVLECSVS